MGFEESVEFQVLIGAIAVTLVLGCFICIFISLYIVFKMKKSMSFVHVTNKNYFELKYSHIIENRNKTVDDEADLEQFPNFIVSEQKPWSMKTKSLGISENAISISRSKVKNFESIKEYELYAKNHYLFMSSSDESTESKPDTHSCCFCNRKYGDNSHVGNTNSSLEPKLHISLLS